MAADAPGLLGFSGNTSRPGRTILPGGDPNRSVFDRRNRPILQRMILDGDLDSDDLLPDLLDYIETNYYNLFCNLETGEHSASPVSRRGNPQHAIRQAFKRDLLKQVLRKSVISYSGNDGLYSHLFFMTLTIDHSVMTRDQANFLITTKGRGIAKFFSRLEKKLDGGYSKVIVKESSVSGYPAVHVILRLDKAMKIKYHRKSNSYRPDPTDPYTKKILGSLRNLDDWNFKSPLWKVGFIDIYGFAQGSMGVKNHSDFVNYISKYITKSLNLTGVENLEGCRKVSDLPEKYRTAAWTILNNLIWNSQMWVISKAFKDRMRRIEEKIKERGSSWMWVDTVRRDNPRLYEWMGYSVVLNPDRTLKSVSPP